MGEEKRVKPRRGFGRWLKDTFIFSSKDTKGQNMNRAFSLIALICFITAAVLAVNFLIDYLGPIHANQRYVEMLVSSDSDSSAASGDLYDAQGVLKKYSELYKHNSDLIGWISLEGTKLNLPVVKEPNDAKDGNTYYLNHTFDKEVDDYGTIFMDYRATVTKEKTSDVLTLYGHTAPSFDDFFGILRNYKDIEYYREHPVIKFDTIYGEGTYKIIGFFTEYTGADPFFRYHDYVNLNEDTFQVYMDEVGRRNRYVNDVDVEFGDSILALSTCNEDVQKPLGTPYRDVVVARKLRPGEDAAINPETIQPNTDVLMPQGWIEKFGKQTPYE